MKLYQTQTRSPHIPVLTHLDWQQYFSHQQKSFPAMLPENILFGDIGTENPIVFVQSIESTIGL